VLGCSCCVHESIAVEQDVKSLAPREFIFYDVHVVGMSDKKEKVERRQIYGTGTPAEEREEERASPYEMDPR
jgi:hypothetical protein